MKKINTDVLIVGAGPVGLFSVFELGQLGIKACIVDCLNEVGGQCSALYPEKPIYDIPAYPVINAQELILNLSKQIKPFNPKVLLSQQVEKIIDLDNSFKVFTTGNTEISAKCIFIAAGNGAFGPNKPPIKNIEKFENKSVFYSIKNKSIFDNKTIDFSNRSFALRLSCKSDTSNFVLKNVSISLAFFFRFAHFAGLS